MEKTQSEYIIGIFMHQYVKGYCQDCLEFNFVTLQ